MTDTEILLMPTSDLSDFITWKSFDGKPDKGWFDALEDELEAYWDSLMSSPAEPDEVDETAIFETFLSR